MSTEYVELRLTVRVDIVDGCDGIDRYVELSPEEAAKWSCTPGMSHEDVLGSLAKVSVLTGLDDASNIDGWADLGRGEITTYIEDIEIW